MEFVKYKIEAENLNGSHGRYIQPPQVAYFVTTIDKFGNMNTTPVTMGTQIGHRFFSFTFSNLFIDEWDQEKYPFQDGIKQGYCNLLEVPECVVSYYGYPLIRESWIAAMPIPKGISEIDVMGLTPLPSDIVKPCGIAECPVNLEMKILHTNKLGKKWVNYICEVVQVTVHKDLDDKNKHGPLAGYGISLIDPLLEMEINRGGTPQANSIRLVYGRLDFSKIERCPEDVGCRDYWVGSFKQWINDEQSRDKLTQDEAKRAVELENLWAANRDPAENKEVKEELTVLLKKAVSNNKNT